jgi:hypothetical protein
MEVFGEAALGCCGVLAYFRGVADLWWLRDYC